MVRMLNESWTRYRGVRVLWHRYLLLSFHEGFMMMSSSVDFRPKARSEEGVVYLPEEERQERGEGCTAGWFCCWDVCLPSWRGKLYFFYNKSLFHGDFYGNKFWKWNDLLIFFSLSLFTLSQTFMLTAGSNSSTLSAFEILSASK